MIGRKVRVEGDAEQAAFAGGIDRQVQGRERGAVVMNELDIAPFFKDEESAVGGEFHRRRTGQTAGDGGLDEPRRQCRRRAFALFE